MSVLLPFLDLYPITIISDRYTGVYSGGRFTAWNLYEDKVPAEISLDDVTCNNFWVENKIVCGIGYTPNEALEDLYNKLIKEIIAQESDTTKVD
jgi:hypothetical protein